jgi:hypothetical protein
VLKRGRGNNRTQLLRRHWRNMQFNRTARPEDNNYTRTWRMKCTRIVKGLFVHLMNETCQNLLLRRGHERLSRYELLHLDYNTWWKTVFIIETLTKLNLLRISWFHVTEMKKSIKLCSLQSQSVFRMSAYITWICDPHYTWFVGMFISPEDIWETLF